jgi:hypothetical protein
MSLEAKSEELKEIISTYNTEWFLGDLSKLIGNITNGAGREQLGNLSSPLRQLYFLAGLLISSDDSNGVDVMYDPEKWYRIVELLNKIEEEYDKLFFPKHGKLADEHWSKVRKVVMPSFLSYFNQGPLNYEEQTISWIQNLYTQFDDIIEGETEVKTNDFIQFYNNLDNLFQQKFQGFSLGGDLFDEVWLTYTKIKLGIPDKVPAFIKKMGEKNRPLYTFTADYGIICRFKPEDLVSKELPIERINSILSKISCTRKKSEFLYYTSTRPGNPLYEFPIVNIGNGIFQVFEIKQVIHSIDDLLEKICSRNAKAKGKLINKKGKLLENKTLSIFKNFFKKSYKYYESYYVDGCEQDILFLWKNYAFIIEAKGYNLREPLRDPNKAFVRIKDDFKDSIGYGYTQIKRVEQKFIDQVPLRIEDKDGNLIKEIDTTKFKENEFSIIVNINSFGQIQNDLSTLLQIQENDLYPWVVKLDDLEVFLLTMSAKNLTPQDFINYLLMREQLHEKLICSDELEVCGGYLSGLITEDQNEQLTQIITSPDLCEIFDKQYSKGMGFENEKLLSEKNEGKHIFW